MPHNKKIYLSVVIPAYNESGSIAETIFDVDKYLSEQDFSYEIIVVDDGSKDNTFEVLERFREPIKKLKVIKLEKNIGKGGAVKRGMLESQGEVRFFMDADNSAKIEEIEKLLPFVKNNHQVVIGSRFYADANILKKQHFFRSIMGRLSSLIIRSLVISNVKDTQCGFKLFLGDAADNIFSKMTISNWIFDVEILVIAKKMGYGIKESGIKWTNKEGSSVRFFDYFISLWGLFKIKRNLSKRIYD